MINTFVLVQLNCDDALIMLKFNSVLIIQYVRSRSKFTAVFVSAHNYDIFNKVKSKYLYVIG
jgi:hypothetical protein